jgi:hypothetical protein
MSKHLFEKLAHAIKHGRAREAGEAVNEIKKAAAHERPSFATVKLAAIYNPAEDCLEILHTVDLGSMEECLGIIARAVVAPDGQTILSASTELLDPQKHNKCVSGCTVLRHLADNYDGRCVTVHVCALAIDAAGKVTLVTTNEEVAISAIHPRA